MTNTKFKKYTVAYQYRNGFICNMIVEALDEKQAIAHVRKEIIMAYGSTMAGNFSFKII